MSSYRRLVIDVPGDFSTLRDDEVQFPELLENEVLVKMEYSTVNPSDYYLAMGGYPGTFPPVSLGIEGSGTVTQAGSSEYAQSLINTRVAVRGRGSWGEYMKLDSDYVFPLLDSTPFDQASNLVVNPMTVAYFIDIIQKSNHKVVIQNAAASSLGKMFIKWCNQNSVSIINLVRREEQATILREINAKHVVNTSEENWKAKLQEIIQETGAPTAGFDAVAGKDAGDLLESLAPKGAVYTYGRLSGQDAQVPCTQLMFYDKSLHGLFLSNWLATKNREERAEVGFFVQRNLENVFATQHSKVVNLEELKGFLKDYKKEQATNNKVLVRNRYE